MMKKTIGVMFLLLCSAAAFGQSATVTAQILDPSGLRYSNCTYTVTFQDSPNLQPGQQSTSQGIPLTSGQKTITGSCDSSGNISLTTLANTGANSVLPAGSTWKYAIVASGGSPTFSVVTSYGSGAVSLSGVLSGSAPALSTFVYLAFYGVPTGTCSALWQAVDVTTGKTYSCDAGSWVAAGGGGGFTAGGDLAGSSTTQEVIGLLNSLLPSLTTGFLNYTGSTWAFTTLCVNPSGTGIVFATNGSPCPTYSIISGSSAISGVAGNGDTNLQTATRKITTVTEGVSANPYSPASSDQDIYTDTTSGNQQITLPLATGSGRHIKSNKLVAGSTITFQLSGSDTIDGTSAGGTFTQTTSNTNLDLVDYASGAWRKASTPLLGFGVIFPSSDAVCSSGADSTITGVTCNNSSNATVLTNFATVAAVPAGFLQQGHRITIKLGVAAWSSASGVPTVVLTVQYAGTTVYTSAATAVTASTTNQVTQLVFDIYSNAAPSSSSASFTSALQYSLAGFAGANQMNRTAQSVNINTSAAGNITFGLTYTTAVTGNAMKIQTWETLVN